MSARTVRIGPVAVGAGAPLVLIAGPCQIEGAEATLAIAARLADICARLGVPLVFKASFDKANRTAGTSPRGPGLEAGLAVLARIRAETGLPVLTDVHTPEQCAPVAQVCDALQIPALLCRQTDLLAAAGRTGRPVNIKKGQFLAPADMAHAAAKVAAAGSGGVLLCERGTSFGYHTLVSDFRALPVMAETGWPVVFDATHSVQQPGAAAGASGGQRRFVAPLARAAVAVGCDALFLETHPDPDRAPSDGPCMLPLDAMEGLLAQVLAIRRAVVDG